MGKKHITIKIYENGDVDIRDQDNKPVNPVKPDDPRSQLFQGPHNCYEQIMWVTANPICFYHRGRLH